jgi:hypothetical protein
MLICMRTTLNLPDALFEAARAKASAEGRTLTSLVEEGLRAVLMIPEPRTAPVPLPAFGQHDQQFLVDLDDRDAMWEALDSDSPSLSQ